MVVIITAAEQIQHGKYCHNLPILSTINIYILPFHYKDLFTNSPYCLSQNSLDANLVLDWLIIPLLIFFFILVTYLLDIVLML